jgi:choline dehydrogenase-like flavoprotein
LSHYVMFDWYFLQTFRAIFPYHHNTTQEGFVLLASCLLPSSRGTVTLNENDPFSEPVIDPQYLQHPYDIACMIRGEYNHSLLRTTLLTLECC